jgi:hypothetical protein
VLIYGIYFFNKDKKFENCSPHTHLVRKRRKSQMFYNIQNNNAPMYLCDLIPPSIQSTTVYPLRNGSDIKMPFCRLSMGTIEEEMIGVFAIGTTTTRRI